MIGPFTTMAGGFTHVLVAIDKFTKWIEYKPIAKLTPVDETIANHIDLDGLPLRIKRMLRNSHLDSAPGNTFFPILHSIVLWRLVVEEQPK
jgi:hypothetical protein